MLRSTKVAVFKGYIIAVICAVAAVVTTRWIKNPLFPTPLYFASVSIATWYGGGLPGVLVVAFSTLALNYYFVPPEGSVSLLKPESPYVLQFAIPALLTCWLVRKRKIAETSLRQARDELESRVQQRQAELTRVARMLSVGEMGVSIAHEVNQPLMAIVLNGDACLRWLSTTPPNLEEARLTISRIVDEGARAGEIVRRIRTLSKKTVPHPVPVDLNQLISDTTLLLDRDLLSQVRLELDLAPHLPLVDGDPVQIQQVIFNLVTNAIEAMSTVVPDSRRLRISSQLLPDRGVAISIEDSGPGLPACDHDQLFAAFFTTKPEGVGIGLSISRTIVEAHGGRLWARNAPKGAVFQFELPLTSGEAPGAR